MSKLLEAHMPENTVLDVSDIQVSTCAFFGALARSHLREDDEGLAREQSRRQCCSCGHQQALFGDQARPVTTTKCCLQMTATGSTGAGASRLDCVTERGLQRT